MPPQIDDELLVAYLDGELPQEQHATISRSLESDAQLRQRVSSLRASWDLLGALPPPQPRKDLAQSTIEIVTLAMDRDARSWWQWLVERRWLAVGMGGVLMLLLGAATARGLTRYMTRQILANLPTIVEYRGLQNIDSVEFLEQLSQIPNLIPAAGEGTTAVIADGLVPTEIADRQAWVENLQEVDRGRLENNLLELNAESDARKAELREITDAILADPAKSKLYIDTIRAYATLLDRLGAQPKASLRRMAVDERLVEIRQRVGNEMALNYVPNNQDRAAIRSWLDDMLFTEASSDTLNFHPDPDSLIIYELLNRDSNDSFITQENVDDLIENRLSPAATQRLQALNSESAQRYHVGLWISAAVQTPINHTSSTASDGNLEQKFQNLPEGRRVELEWMPEDEVHKALRQVNIVPPPGASPPATNSPGN